MNGDVIVLEERRRIRARLSALEAYVGMPNARTDQTPAGVTQGELDLLLAFHADIRYAYSEIGRKHAQIRDMHAEIMEAARRAEPVTDQPSTPIKNLAGELFEVCEEITARLRPLIATDAPATGLGTSPDSP